MSKVIWYVAYKKRIGSNPMSASIVGCFLCRKLTLARGYLCQNIWRDPTTTVTMEETTICNARDDGDSRPHV